MENRPDNNKINNNTKNHPLDEQDDSLDESSLTDNPKESILIETLQIESPSKFGEQTNKTDNKSILPNISQNKIQSKVNKLTEAFENMLGTKQIIHKDSNFIILKPHFLFDILHQLKIMNSISAKVDIVEKLIWLVTKIHTNAYIITSKSILKDMLSEKSYHFLQECIDILISHNREGNFTEKMLSFISQVIYLSGVKRDYIKYIFEQLSKSFSNQHYDSNKFLLYIKLLNAMYKKTIYDLDINNMNNSTRNTYNLNSNIFPDKFFYFNNQNSGLRCDSESLQSKNISLVNGYTLGIWIRLENVNVVSNMKIIDSSIIFSFTTSKKVSIEVFLKNKSLYYRVSSDNNLGELNHLLDIETNQWTMLVFSHKPWYFLSPKSELTVWKDNFESFVIKHIEYPNFKNSKLMSINFFKDFTGQVSNIFFLNEYLSNNTFIKDLCNFKFGLYSEKQIRIFKESIINRTKSGAESLTNSFLFIYSPCRIKSTYNISNSLQIKDILDNIDGEIYSFSENSNLVGGVANINIKNIYQFGSDGFSDQMYIFLPIFEFFTNNFFNSTEVFCEALDLLMTVLVRNTKSKSKLSQDVINLNSQNKNTQNNGSTLKHDYSFFNQMGLFMQKYNRPLFQKNILIKLLNITDLVLDSPRGKDFCKWILFNPLIFTKFEMEIQIEFWKSIYEKYSNNISVFNSYFDARDFLEIIVKVYDTDVNLYCCEEHMKMLCEQNKSKETSPLNTQQFGNKLYNLISNPPQMNKITHILSIIENILSSNKIVAVDQLKSIINLMSYELSPCLQKSLIIIFLKVFKSNTLSESLKNQYISGFIKAKGLEHILFLASISTLDVRMESLCLLEFFTKTKTQLPIHVEDELIPFLVYSIFPLKTPTKSSEEEKNSMKTTLKFTILNDHFNREAKLLGNKPKDLQNEKLGELNNPMINTNMIEMQKDNFFPSEEDKLLHALDDSRSLVGDYVYNYSEIDRKISAKNTLLNDLNTLNKLNFHDQNYKIKGFENQKVDKKQNNIISKLKEKDKNETNSRYLSNNSLNSLESLEDDYWRFMFQSKLVKKFNIPYSYIREYSNNINDFYLDAIYSWAMDWLLNRTSNDCISDETQPHYLPSKKPVVQDYQNLVSFNTSISGLNLFKNNLPEKIELNSLSNITIKKEISESIHFHPILNILMKIVSHSNIRDKKKFLVDLLILTSFNKNNCYLILENKYFYQWLLDTILPFVIIQENLHENKQSSLAATIMELGIKIHTNVLINVINRKNPSETNSSTSIPSIDLGQIFDQLLTWYYKVRKVDYIIEAKSASNLLRLLFSHLLSEFSTLLKKFPYPNSNYEAWQSFINLTATIYEFVVFSNFDKKIYEKSLNLGSMDKSEIFSEIIQNLNYDYEGENLSGSQVGLQQLNQNNNFKNQPSLNPNNEEHVNTNKCNISMMDIWVDRHLLLSLYECYKSFWQEAVFKLDKKSSSTLSDEYKFIENLVNKLIFDNRPNFFYEDFKILLNRTDNSSNSSNNYSSNLMRIILNIIIIFIRLSENKQEVLYWVKELEKFTLFIISASENTKPDFKLQINESILNYACESTARNIIIVFNFLHDELNSPRRREFSDELIEVFKSTIRFLFIFFTHIVERINTIKESKEKKQNSIFLSALRNIKNVIMFKLADLSYHFSPCWKVYNDFLLDKNKCRIFTMADIKEYKLNKYVEIPERFNTETWQYAFGENNICYNILKDGFNFSVIEKTIINRTIHADNMNFNPEICFKEKSFINKVIKNVSSAIKDSLISLEKRIRNDIYEYHFISLVAKDKWRESKMRMFLLKGEWCQFEKFLSDDKIGGIKYTVENHYTSYITRPVLMPIYKIKTYLPKFSRFDMNKTDLFLETSKEISSHNSKNIKLNFNLIHDSSDDSLEIKKNSFFKSPIKTQTNKSSLYYTNSDYSDFVEKYADLEKLLTSINSLNSLNMESNKNIHSLLSSIKLNISDMFVENIKSQTLLTLKACRVKLKGHVIGQVVVTKHEVFFIRRDECNRSQKLLMKDPSENLKYSKCHESLFPSKGKFLLEIPINTIKQIYKRRYFYKKTALEIFTYESKSYFFNFSSPSERDNFCKVIYDTQYSNSIKPNPYMFEYHLDIKKNPGVLNRLIEEWVNWRISNLELITNLNNLAGRSYHDLTQYPVFPWVCLDYTSPSLSIPATSQSHPSKFLRDLSKPIGALGKEERTELFKNTYKECIELNSEHHNDNPLNKEGKYFYNSHYSNPFYVTNFLARLLPYTACAIELQGEGFDNPQRQFLSINTAFENSMSQSTDVRELLPEFFYLPELFLNLNRINFGKIDNNYIEDVSLPPWAKDAYRFVHLNRLLLESEEVSYKINEWVDLIFGSRQKGKEAETHMNLFWRSTYEDEIDIEHLQKSNSDEYLSYMSKIYMGQTPSQILIKPSVQRINKSLTNKGKVFLDNRKGLKVFNSTSEIKNGYSIKNHKEIRNKMIVRIKALQGDRIVVVYNNMTIQIMKVDETPYTQSKFIFIKEKEYELPEQSSAKRICDEDESIVKEINSNQPIKILANGKLVVKGGFYDGKFSVFNLDTEESLFFQTDEDSKVTCIESDENDETLFLGTDMGRVHIFNIEEKTNDILVLKKILTHHEGPVNYIFICSKLKVVATVANDKTCNLYTYPLMNQFKVIKADNFNYDYVFLSSSPLPSVILYSKTNLSFYCYSLNGALIHTENDGVKYLFTPSLISDALCRDHLVYGTQFGDLYVRPLPYFSGSWKMELSKYHSNGQNKLPSLPIKCFDFSKDKRSLFFWQLEDFNISVIRDPKESKKKKTLKNKSEEETKLKNLQTPFNDINVFESR